MPSMNLPNVLPKVSHWQPSRSGTGFATEYEDIQQSISNILETPLGSNPLRPDFGSNVNLYIDWPTNRARPHLVRETVEAIKRWEKRVTVTKVIVTSDLEHTTIRPYFVLADGVERFVEVQF